MCYDVRIAARSSSARGITRFPYICAAARVFLVIRTTENYNYHYNPVFSDNSSNK